MKALKSWDGELMRHMFAAGTAWLQKSAAEIDALNVFPVPDGDTGTNMLLTMRAAMDEAYRVGDGAGEVVQAMASGALLGARGNSGVILSQFFGGLSSSLSGKKSIAVEDLARALHEASIKAYKGVNRPVEGTLLTVIRDVAEGARGAVEISDDLITVMGFVVRAAKDSVARTPALLAVLREAGVVDAGGQGLYVLLDGALAHLKGEGEELQYRRPMLATSGLPQSTRLPPMAAEEARTWGYCTELLLRGEKLDTVRLRRRLQRRGDSLMVVGDDSLVRVHIHTFDPGGVIHVATSVGVLHQVKVENIDDQHKDFIQMQKVKAPPVNIATVVVVSGDGLAEVFKSLGATAVVSGGRTMNPSTKELLHAVESVVADSVILLPNNKNVVPAAKQVPALAKKKVAVVASESIPQGVAALLALDYGAGLKTNVEAMEKACSAVKTVEITRAARPVRLNGGRVKRRQPIGFLDGKLVAAGDDMKLLVEEVVGKALEDGSEVITIYYGADTEGSEAEGIAEVLRSRHPGVEVEVVCGAQPHYNYLISVE
ncbi:MAG: DAK2 domain-containing protein [Dehalococcoidia bacterium]|nr:DAK2 domain-containing protein [Dehalococcoidia bacterium]